MELAKIKVMATLYCNHFFFTRQENAKKKIQEQILQATGKECPPFVLTSGFHTHIPSIDYARDYPVMKYDTILAECKIKYTDAILELLYITMATNVTNHRPSTGHL